MAAFRNLAAPLLRAARAPMVASRVTPFQSRAIAPIAARFYASGPGLSQQDIQSRIVDVLKSFEKVDPSKVTPSSAFTADLGLDSLDAVEVVMAIEEEFSIEIPDAEADNITTVQQAIDYISKSPEAH
ncbi:acyl carrier protein [Violaceomyces palustris]|uniref:Acyl carrier protein n=1 Tax=Violaceomyces palustris TaxID=1673888 RepID=A0ACD0NZV3_9BASI|nr:acyl carrier protein [Violaceomyces palustris]